MSPEEYNNINRIKNSILPTENVKKTLSDSDKELLNLIAEIIVKIILEEEE